MRILVAVHGFPPTQYAGAERAAERIANWLSERDHEVEVLALENVQADSFQVQTQQEGGLLVHRVSYNIKEGDYFKNLYDYAPIGDVLRNILSQRHFDLVHMVSGYMLGGQVIDTANAFKIPVVVTLTEYWFMCHQLTLQYPDGKVCIGPESAKKCTRCLLEEKRRWSIPKKHAPHLMDTLWNGLLKTSIFKNTIDDVAQRQIHLAQSLSRAALVISPSRFLINKFKEYGFNTEHYVHISHGLTVTEQHPTGSPITAQTPKTSGLNIAFLGQMKAHKGPDIIIDAVIQLLKAGHEVHLGLYGPDDEIPEYTAPLKHKTAAYPSIQWHGRYEAEQLGEILAQQDVLVIASRWYENNPTVILEAYRERLPVIASRMGGMTEMVIHEQSGLLFENNSVTDLHHQLERLIVEPDLLPKLRQGVPVVKTINEELEEIYSEYQKLLEKTKAQ
jgi:glycosyltransferase involved in cell wall biosynthesis